MEVPHGVEDLGQRIVERQLVLLADRDICLLLEPALEYSQPLDGSNCVNCFLERPVHVEAVQHLDGLCDDENPVLLGEAAFHAFPEHP